MRCQNLFRKFYDRKLNILLFEFMLVFFVFSLVYFYATPKQISPFDGMAISSGDFAFEVENGDSVVISNNPEFENPIVLTENSEITLAPGEYFWKARNRFKESETRRFILKERVGLDLVKSNNKTFLKNSGNTDLRVSEINSTIKFILKNSEIKIIEGNKSYAGEKNG